MAGQRGKLHVKRGLVGADHNPVADLAAVFLDLIDSNRRDDDIHRQHKDRNAVALFKDQKDHGRDLQDNRKPGKPGEPLRLDGQRLPPVIAARFQPLSKDDLCVDDADPTERTRETRDTDERDIQRVAFAAHHTHLDDQEAEQEYDPDENKCENRCLLRYIKPVEIGHPFWRKPFDRQTVDRSYRSVKTGVCARKRRNQRDHLKDFCTPPKSV